jgi:hypothetical protein
MPCDTRKDLEIRIDGAVIYLEGKFILNGKEVCGYLNKKGICKRIAK